MGPRCVSRESAYIMHACWDPPCVCVCLEGCLSLLWKVAAGHAHLTAGDHASDGLASTVRNGVQQLWRRELVPACILGLHTRHVLPFSDAGCSCVSILCWQFSLWISTGVLGRQYHSSQAAAHLQILTMPLCATL
jgi:hypothetical protein